MSGDPADKRSPGLGIVFLVIFLDLAGFSIVFPLFPGMLEFYLANDTTGLLPALHGWLERFSGAAGGDVRTTAVLFGGVLGSLYAALQFLFAPLWGSLSDKYGRRPMLLFTCSGALLGYLVWFFAGTFETLVLARVIGGAMAGNLSVATAVVADVTTRENRAKGMGMAGAAIGLGFVFGPTLGGMFSKLDLTQSHPGLASFGVNPFSACAAVAVLLAAGNLLFVATRLRETLPTDKRETKVNWRDRIAVLGVLSLRSDALRRVNLTSWIYLLAFSAMEFTLAFLLAGEPFNLGPLGIAGVMVYVGVILILTQGFVVRRLVPKIGEAAGARFGLMLVASGLALLAWAPSIGWVYAAQTLAAVGAGLSNASLSALASLYASTSEQGRVSGLFRSLGSLSRALGPIIGAYVFWRLGAPVAYLGAAVLTAAALALAWPLPPAQSNVRDQEGGRGQVLS